MINKQEIVSKSERSQIEKIMQEKRLSLSDFDMKQKKA